MQESRRLCSLRTTLHTSFPVFIVRTCLMHPVCWYSMLRIAAGPKKCVRYAESQKTCLQKYSKAMKPLARFCRRLQKNLACRRQLRSLPVQETTQQLLLAQVLSVMVCVTFLLVHPEQFLFLPISLALMKTMHCIPLTTPTDIII